jgi:hypothetical protein
MTEEQSDLQPLIPGEDYYFENDLMMNPLRDSDPVNDQGDADKDRTANKPSGGKGKPRPLRREGLVQSAHDVLLKWSKLSP